MMNQGTFSDKELIDQFLAGNEVSLELLIHRYKQKVYTSILMFVREVNTAEDLFQDTFIKVINTLRGGTYKEEGKFGPWVMRIAYNLCVDHFRRNKRNPNVKTTDDFDIFDVIGYADENIEDKITREETYQKVRLLVDMLPPEQKEVVVLRHYAGLSFKEISELTDVSINTALGRMRYALINMRKIITQKEILL